MKKYIVFVATLLLCIKGRCDTKLKVAEAVNAFYKVGSDWKPISVRQLLEPGMTIKVDPQGSLVFLNDNKVFCIPKSEAVVIKAVKDVYAKEPDSYWKQFVSAFYDWVNPPKDIGSTVTRRGGFLMLFPANNEVLPGGNCNFIWRRDGRSAFDVFITEESRQDDWLFKKEGTKDTALAYGAIGAQLGKFAEGKTYYWTVNPTGDQNQEGYFTRFSVAGAATKKELKEALESLENSRADIDEHTFQVLTALCYEHFKMYSMAYNVYDGAAKRFPESKMIADMRNEFVRKIIIANQPQK